MAVEKLQLPEDSDYLRDSVQNCVAISFLLPGYQSATLWKSVGILQILPTFGLIDIFNYLIFNRSDYDGEKTERIQGL